MAKLADVYLPFADFCTNACLPTKKSVHAMVHLDGDPKGKVNYTAMPLDEFGEVWAGLHRKGFAKYREVKGSETALPRMFRSADLMVFRLL